MNADFLIRGVLFAAGVWVLIASVWRLNLMQWGRSQCLQLLAYMVLSMSALGGYVLNIAELQPACIVGVALLFLAGRKRWLTRAPADTERLG